MSDSARKMKEAARIGSNPRGLFHLPRFLKRLPRLDLAGDDERYGREVVKIERWYPSSKQCSGCGHRVESLPLFVRKWRCQTCGASHDRDINAAINVKIAAGLAEIQNARGGETPFQLPLAFG